MILRFDRNNRFDYTDFITLTLQEDIPFGKFITAEGKLAGNDSSLCIGITVEDGKSGNQIKVIKAGKIVSTDDIFLPNTIYYSGIDGTLSLSNGGANPQILAVGLSKRELLIDISFNKVSSVFGAVAELTSINSKLTLTDDGTDQKLHGNLGDLVISSTLNTVIEKLLETNGIQNTGEIFTESLNVNDLFTVDNLGNMYTKNIVLDGYINSDNSFDIRLNKIGNTTLKIFNPSGTSYVDLQNLTVSGNIDLENGNIINLKELIFDDGVHTTSIKINADGNLEVADFKLNNLEVLGTINGIDLDLFKQDYDSKIDQSLKTTSDVTFNSIKSDIINENTENAGVTIEGVTIKDGLVDGIDISSISTSSHAQNTDIGTNSNVFEISIGELDSVKLVTENGNLAIVKNNQTIYTGIKAGKFILTDGDIEKEIFLNTSGYIEIENLNVSQSLIVENELKVTSITNDIIGNDINVDVYNSTKNSIFRITNSDGIYVAILEVDEQVIGNIRLKVNGNVLEFKNYADDGFKDIKVNTLYSESIKTTKAHSTNNKQLYVDTDTGEIYSSDYNSTTEYIIAEGNNNYHITSNKNSIEAIIIEVVDPVVDGVISIGSLINTKDILNDTIVDGNDTVYIQKNILNDYYINFTSTSGKIKITSKLSDREYFTYSGTSQNYIHRQFKVPVVRLIENNEEVFVGTEIISNNEVKVTTCINITGKIIIE